jgi:hypothetical protein
MEQAVASLDPLARREFLQDLMEAVAEQGLSVVLSSHLVSRGIREAVTYQPVSRYWAFQWTETGIFMALALALGGFCFWRLSRRRY